MEPADHEAVQRAIAAFRGRVRQMRERRGWSLGDAERVSGVTRSHWRKLENGPSEPQLSSLLRIQRAFGLPSVENLFGPMPSERLMEGGESTDSPP